jgi:PAS domain S-box-containing protein
MPAVIVHDTQSIVDANEEACALFGQELEDLIDGNLLEGVSNGDMKFLVKLRMYLARMKGRSPRERIKFARLNGSVFWAWSETVRRDDGLFETTLTYIDEY